MHWLKTATGTDDMQSYDGPSPSDALPPQDASGLVEMAVRGSRDALIRLEQMIRSGNEEVCGMLFLYQNVPVLQNLVALCGQSTSPLESDQDDADTVSIDQDVL